MPDSPILSVRFIDAFNRTTKVETNDGQVQVNRYDAEGLRYEMEENGKLVQFIFNQNREVVVETSDAGINRLIRSHELLCSSADYASTYYHYASDELGSITHVTDGNGQILNHYEYDAFGNIVEQTETVANRFKYTGQQMDSVTQQYYLRARFYNPVIARFTQEDTYRGDGLNLYAYCANNPVMYVDPSGYCGKGKDVLGVVNPEILALPAPPKLLALPAPPPGTLIDNQVRVIEQAELPSWMSDSFKNGTYTTVQRTEDIFAYRTFGGRADAGGAFVSTTAVANRIQAAEDLALLPEWGNSRMYEAVVGIPSGTTLNIGKVAAQTTRSGNVLAGGADQILLPQNWPLEWIQDIRVVPSR